MLGRGFRNKKNQICPTGENIFRVVSVVLCVPACTPSLKCHLMKFPSATHHCVPLLPQFKHYYVVSTEAETSPSANHTNAYDEIQRWFKRNMCNLQVVPNNIPAEALRVYLQDNNIIYLPPGVFSNLSKSHILHLERNKISSIERESFIGLTKLKRLYLGWNPIFLIFESAFDNLHSIKMIGLNNIPLTFLPSNLFLNLPRKPLGLALSGPANQWECNSLCWLKFEEFHETVVWESVGKFPTCADVEDWSLLQCGHPGKNNILSSALVQISTILCVWHQAFCHMRVIKADKA